MFHHRNSFGLGIAALGAGEGLCSLGCAGGLLGDFGGVCMLGLGDSCDLCLLIATFSCANTRFRTLLCAGRFFIYCPFCGEFVTQLLYRINIHIVAESADFDLCTIGCASGFYDAFRRIDVGDFRDFLCLGVAAVTLVGIEPLLRTSGGSGTH